MTQEQNEEVNYLLEEYKQKRNELNEMQADVNSIRDQLVLLFNKYKMKERIYLNKLFKLDTHIIYIYPASCKNHKNTIKKQSNEYIKMTKIE